MIRADLDGDWIRCILPGGPVRLRSRSAVAADVWPDSFDPRRLGVAVTDILLEGCFVPLDDGGLGDGWHSPEQGARWTKGNACLDVDDATHLDIRLVCGAMRYPAVCRPTLQRRAL